MAELQDDKAFLNLGQTLSGSWPSFLPRPADDSLLNEIWLTSPATEANADSVFFSSTLMVLKEVAFALPGLNEVSFVIGGDGESTALPLFIQVLPDTLFRVEELPIALRIRSDVLLPARRAEAVNPGEAARWEVDPTRKFVDITLAHVTFEINGDGDIKLATDVGVDLPPSMIGESGIVVQAREVSFHFDPNDPPAGQPVGFRGIHLANATLALPGELGDLIGELSVSDAFISNGGFSGTVATTFPGGHATELYGLGLRLDRVSIGIVQNAFTAASLFGSITLPFFDEELEVEISFTLSGDFSVRLANDDGLLILRKDGVFDFEVESLGFTVEDGLFRALMSGKLTPTLRPGDLRWPTFDIRELSIDANGHVRLEGGWLNLPQAYTLSFYGFQFEITKLGFGQQDDGGKWIGLNGALRLVDGIQAGASVEGLRLTWFDDRDPVLSLDGVGIELEIPNSLRFKGFVGFKELSEGGETVRRFDGQIALELLALDLSIDAQLVFGSANAPDGSYNFMGIFLGVELPAGIPLFSTGLALYGMAGLFASQLGPDKTPDEEWYGVGPSDGWYKKPPEIGVSNLRKWKNQRDALGLGVGVTLGTLADNGYAFSGRVLLLLLFPGPVLMIEGRANLLRERSKLNDEPVFRTLAVLDFNARTFLFGVDAQYSYDESGSLIALGGSAEAFFNLNDADDWHLYVGQKEPREKRIRASVFKLFEANAYFMLSSRSVALGAWFGFSKSWKFGPLRVSAELWSESNVEVSWRPPQFQGGMLWHGGVRLSAFGIGLGLSVEVGVQATVFEPFHLVGRFRVGISTPWPLPDVSATVTLEWGPERRWPKLPLPLAEVAIEHMKVTTSWPLPRQADLLVPNYDAGGGLVNTDAPQPSYDANTPPTGTAPVVPMDARPRLTFGRPVHDDAGVNVNARAVSPEREIIGDPAKNEGPVAVRYSLREVALEKWDGSAWVVVARKAQSSLGENPSGVQTLFGSWAPIPDPRLGDGSGDAGGHIPVKLWLWSANPFDYTRRIGRSWDERFTEKYPGYPCPQVDSPKEVCYDFETIPLSTPLDNGPSSFDPYVPSFRHPDNPGLEIIVDDALIAGVPLVQLLPGVLGGRRRGVCFTPLPAAVPNAPPPPTSSPLINALLSRQLEVAPVPAGNKALLIVVPTPNVGVQLLMTSGATVIGFDADGAQHGATRTGDVAEILVTDVRFVVAYWSTPVCLAGVCLVKGATEADLARIGLAAQQTVEAVEHFEQTGFVLESHTEYRLAIDTLIDAQGGDELDNRARRPIQREYAFFRTAGPPRLADLSIPLGQDTREEIKLRNPQGQLIRNDGTEVIEPVLSSELNALGIYVRQTLPATVAARGSIPDLPRPVYRAYDLGVEFNENYVQLMYRLAARDLGFYLYDQNNAPIRDTDGRLLVVRPGWDVAAEPTIDSTEQVWITTLSLSTCAGTLNVEIPRDEALAVEGITLEADTVYDARLIPLLLHDAFSADKLYPLGASASGTGARLGRWVVEDQGGGVGASLWIVAEKGDPPSRFIVQTTDYFAGSLDGRVPDKPGAVLWLSDLAELPSGHQDQPSSWSDYRFTVIARAADDDAMGVIFRRSTEGRYYRFSLDRERKYRRLTLHLDGSVRILSEDEFVFQKDRDYELAIEVIGASIVVYQDGEQVFAVSEGSLPQGTIGLYCWGLAGGAFADVRVDDLRLTARPAFVYRFTTSRFASFAHEVHSYQDEIWSHAIDASAAALLDAAVPSAEAPSPEEHRAWDALQASPALDSLVRTPVNEVQVVRLSNGTQAPALVVRSPEPLDVRRTTLEVFRADAVDAPSQIPGALKLTGITRHESDPNRESISLIVRDELDPSGVALEHRRLPPLLFLADSGQSLLDERFDEREPHGLLFRETFGPGALDLYEIVDEGDVGGPSAWSVDAETILQSSNIRSLPASAANLAKRGTNAVRGRGDFRNVHVRALASSDDNDSFGIVFRYRDAENYYRFELNQAFGYRRLVKKVAGSVTLLWEDTSRSFELGRDVEIEVIAFERFLIGFVDQALEFVVEDASLELGRVGLYCWASQGTRFKALSVHSADRFPILMRPPSDVAGLTTDDQGTEGAPSNWQIAGSEIVQLSQIRSLDAGPRLAGTVLVAGSSDFRNVSVSVRARSTQGRGIGVVFRYQDPANYYRFSMDSAGSYRRLIKLVDGVATVLAEDGVAYAVGEPHDITARAEGRRLRVWLDGVALFDVDDSTYSSGRVGLYTWNDGSASFESWTVLDPTPQIGRFEIVDEGRVNRPSDWRIASGVLQQRSNLRGGDEAASAPEKPGTLAIAGDPEWRDYRVSVNVRSEDDEALGVVFRYEDEDNYYRFSLDASRSYRRLIKKTAGVVSVLFEDAGSYAVGADINLTVDAIGAQLRLYHDGAAIFSGADSDHAKGRVGVYAWGNEDVRFDSVRVDRPTLEGTLLFQDRFAANDLSGWSIIDRGTEAGPSQWAIVDGELRQTSEVFSSPTDANSLEKEGTYAVAGDATWTDVVLRVQLASTDDDAIGVMFRYVDDDNYYRFSMDRERAYRRLVKKEAGVFTLLWHDSQPYESDRVHELTLLAQGGRLEGHVDGILAFSVIDLAHGAGRVALYAWANEGARFARVRVYPAHVFFERFALDEQFPVLRSFRWSFEDEGTVGAPSSWSVVDEHLVQTSDIRGADPGARSGSHALAGEEAWDDYRLTATLRSSTGGGMGLVFRVGADGYYRFAIDQDTQSCYLLKKQGGVFTVLFSTPFQLELDLDYVLTVECVGSELAGYVNAVRMFALHDEGLASGKVGVYAHANSGLAVDRVTVLLEQWMPFYRFGKERTLSAGTRLRVFSGSVPEPSLIGPLEQVRQAAPAFEDGDIQLPTGSVDVRVVTADGTSQHQRRFLSDAQYTPLEFELLRKADGTSWAIVPTAGPFTAGQHRLRFTYRRDAEPQKLSERGEGGDEVAQIDVPWEPASGS